MGNAKPKPKPKPNPQPKPRPKAKPNPKPKPKAKPDLPSTQPCRPSLVAVAIVERHLSPTQFFSHLVRVGVRGRGRGRGRVNG